MSFSTLHKKIGGYMPGRLLSVLVRLGMFIEQTEIIAEVKIRFIEVLCFAFFLPLSLIVTDTLVGFFLVNRGIVVDANNLMYWLLVYIVAVFIALFVTDKACWRSTFQRRLKKVIRDLPAIAWLATSITSFQIALLSHWRVLGINMLLSLGLVLLAMLIMCGVIGIARVIVSHIEQLHFPMRLKSWLVYGMVLFGTLLVLSNIPNGNNPFPYAVSTGLAFLIAKAVSRKKKVPVAYMQEMLQRKNPMDT